MELRHLRSFRVVAEEGHVTRAAKRLSIAQPALTQQIKTLEYDLGVTLLERAGRGVEITEAGRYLQGELETILALVRTTCEKAREIQGKSSRAIRIAMTHGTTLASSVTNLIGRFRQEHPTAILRECLLDSRDLTSALRDGRVDAVICLAELNPPIGLQSCSIGHSSALLAVPKGHCLDEAGEAPLERLVGSPLTLVSQRQASGSLETRFRALCMERNVEPDIVEVTANVFLALNKVAAGNGIALLPSDVVGLHSNRVAYRPICDCSSLEMDCRLYVRQDEANADIVELFHSPSRTRTEGARFPN